MAQSDTVIESWVRSARARQDAGALEVGADISHLPAVKIVFEGYAEEDRDSDPITCEHYAVYIHRDAAGAGFVFPPHRNANVFSFVQRPADEVRHAVWYCLEQDLWCSPPLALSVDGSGLKLGQVERIVERIDRELTATCCS
jgi:hypothetical protein